MARFPDAESLANADREVLETLIRSTGFHRNKAKNIQGACQKIVEDFNSKVPQTMEELLLLPGVARKTANVVLAHAFGVSCRGYSRYPCQAFKSTFRVNKKRLIPLKLKKDLMSLLPQNDWENYSIRIIYHGRQICKARNPNCQDCLLAHLCPSVQ